MESADINQGCLTVDKVTLDKLEANKELIVDKITRANGAELYKLKEALIRIEYYAAIFKVVTASLKDETGIYALMIGNPIDQERVEIFGCMADLREDRKKYLEDLRDSMSKLPDPLQAQLRELLKLRLKLHQECMDFISAQDMITSEALKKEHHNEDRENLEVVVNDQVNHQQDASGDLHVAVAPPINPNGGRIGDDIIPNEPPIRQEVRYKAPYKPAPPHLPERRRPADSTSPRSVQPLQGQGLEREQ